jgi:uncharacterized membrane protein
LILIVLAIIIVALAYGYSFLGQINVKELNDTDEELGITPTP